MISFLRGTTCASTAHTIERGGRRNVQNAPLMKVTAGEAISAAQLQTWGQREREERAGERGSCQMVSFRLLGCKQRTNVRGRAGGGGLTSKLCVHPPAETTWNSTAHMPYYPRIHRVKSRGYSMVSMPYYRRTYIPRKILWYSMVRAPHQKKIDNGLTARRENLATRPDQQKTAFSFATKFATKRQSPRLEKKVENTPVPHNSPD